MTSFVKAMRSEQAAFLDHHPNANHLLNVIARRARRTKCELNQLEIGECFISFRSVGLSEQQYRTAKKQLEKWNLAEFKKGRKVTDKGTVALLLNSSIYDININEGNGRITEEQRKTNDKQECNKEKNEINIKQVVDDYHELLPNNTKVGTITSKRRSAANSFFKKNKLNEEKFRQYLKAINIYCKWMTEPYQTQSGNTKKNGFDYFISDRCYQLVKDEAVTNGQ